MSLRSINAYLIAKISDRTIERVYERYIADMLHIMAQGKRSSGSPEHWWSEIEKQMLGKAKPKKEENLSAQEIIARVKAAHSKG